MTGTLHTWWQQFRIKLRDATCRHDHHRRFDSGRLYLVCIKCGNTTPGFDMTDTKPPRVIYEKADDRYSAGSTK